MDVYLIKSGWRKVVSVILRCIGAFSHLEDLQRGRTEGELINRFFVRIVVIYSRKTIRL